MNARALVMVLAVAAVVCAAAPGRAGKTFPILSVGNTTFTNAVVTDRYEGTITIRHDGGLATFGVEKLQPDVQRQLGIKPSTPKKPSLPGPKNRPAGIKDVIDDIGGDKFTTAEKIFLLGLPATGILIMMIGQCWILAGAYRVSPGWGLACTVGSFVCGLITLAFVLGHWHEAKRGFLCKMAGLLVVFLSAVAVPNFVQAKKAAEARAAEQSHPR